MRPSLFPGPNNYIPVLPARQKGFTSCKQPFSTSGPDNCDHHAPSMGLSGPAFLGPCFKAERGYALKVGLLKSPQYAVDFAIFSLVLSLENSYPNFLSFHPGAADNHTTDGYVPQPAGVTKQAQEGLDRSFIKKNRFESFEALGNLPQSSKGAWATYAMRWHLRSGDGWQSGRSSEGKPFAQLFSVSLRETLNPNADFFARLTKARLLAVAADLSKTLPDDLNGLKKLDLVDAVAAVSEGRDKAIVYGKDAIETAKKRGHRKAWPSSRRLPRQQQPRRRPRNTPKNQTATSPAAIRGWRQMITWTPLASR